MFSKMNGMFKIVAGILIIFTELNVMNGAKIEYKMSICTDCCELLSCMGLEDSYFTNLTSPQQYIEDMCSQRYVTSLQSCYTTHNLEHCSYLKKVAVRYPVDNNFVNGLEEYCRKRKNDTLALTHCIMAHNLKDDMSIQCSKPYFEAMQDEDSDVCLVFDTMASCMLEMLKSTNCSKVVSLEFAEHIKQEKLKIPLCSSVASHCIHVNILFMIVGMFCYYCFNYK